MDLVSALIEWLDDTEADADFEPDADDEPSFGAEINGQCELELDECDNEPSLGACEPAAPFVRPSGSGA